MRATRLAARLAGLILLSCLAGCVSPKPVVLSSQYVPPSVAGNGTASKGAPPGARCRVLLGEVTDKRSDTQAMGDIGGRPVHATDSAAWLRSALETLGRNGRITLVEASREPDVILGADLLKSYVMSMNTAKTADVVVGAHYTAPGGGGTDGRIYRGTDDSTNWTAGDQETQSALNRALDKVLDQVRADTLARCAAASSK